MTMSNGQAYHCSGSLRGIQGVTASSQEGINRAAYAQGVRHDRQWEEAHAGMQGPQPPAYMISTPSEAWKWSLRALTGTCAASGAPSVRMRENAHLQDGIDGVMEVLAQMSAQAALGGVDYQRAVVQLRDAHVRLGQDHLDQVDGALEEGPLRIHLPQIRPLALHAREQC